MKVSELIELLKPYKDFDLSVSVNLRVLNSELQEKKYGYPWDTYKADLSIDDVGYSDATVSIGVVIND